MSGMDGSPLRFEEEDRLPWLEPVEDAEPERSEVWRLASLVLAGLVLIGVVVGGMWWWQTGGRPRGELIAAPDGAYKVPPKAEPGRFEGEGAIAVAAAEGVQPTAQLDPSRMPEAPVAPPVAGGRPQQAGAAPQTKAALPTAAARSTAAPATPAPAAAPTAAPAAAGSGMVQLGAFSSNASAQRAWTSLKSRFAWLEPVNNTIVTAESGGRTIYRLQAAAGSASAAQTLCNRLRVAGENCIPVR